MEMYSAKGHACILNSNRDDEGEIGREGGSFAPAGKKLLSGLPGGALGSRKGLSATS